MMFVPYRERQPWSILVADARTGTARTVFTADRGMGSAYWAIVAESQLFWGRGDQIVFPWEKTGFVHLWAVPAAGGAPRQLTSGTGEVEFASLAPDGASVLYNTNVGDRDRRHVWRVPVSGGAPMQLTRGAGIEWQPVQSARGQVCVLRSTARVTAHAACLRDDAESPLALAPETVPADFPRDRLVEPTAITVRATDGVETYAQVFLPPNLRPGERRPAAIFLHGGSRRQMLLGWNYGAYYHHSYAFNQALALNGYIVVSLNYRSGIGYGRDFREALMYGASGGSEYNDVVAASRWLRARADVDTAKIALWGGSYGGYLTAMGLTRNPELFAAGVDIHGVHDWNVGIQTFRADYDRYEDPAATALAFSSSPISQVTRWRAPVLLIHGDDDRNVRFIETLTLIEALRKQNVTVEQLVLPDEVHGFLRHESWVRGYEAALDFLNRTLRP
jgi:dipeptidyl aminopeptidase/acylaminoacyl peptidase